MTLPESERTFFLDNGILNVSIEKQSGEAFSIRYKGLEMLAQGSPGGALGGYWSSVGRTRPGGKREAVVRIDPAKNGGERVEVSCKDLSLDASWLKRGTNVVKLKSLADSWSQGVMYDCIRLELADAAKLSGAIIH